MKFMMHISTRSLAQFHNISHRTKSCGWHNPMRTEHLSRRAYLIHQVTTVSRALGSAALSACSAAAVPRQRWKENVMRKWIDPSYCDIRLGFEVTAYVYVR